MKVKKETHTRRSEEKVPEPLMPPSVGMSLQDTGDIPVDGRKCNTPVVFGSTDRLLLPVQHRVTPLDT